MHNRDNNQRFFGLPNIFSSLAGKLTLAFLLIGVMGVLIFALLIGQRTRTEFNRFISDRDQAILIEALTDYYTEYQNWSGVRQALAAPPLNFYVRDIVLLDARGTVELANREFEVGQQVAVSDLPDYNALVVDNETVGYVLWIGHAPGPYMQGPNMPGREARPPAPLEDLFWERILWAAVASGALTIFLALLFGWFLARTLTAPVRELTTATQAMAAGDLNQRVQVHTNDEIGNLATSFNQMSSDLARASQTRKQMTADLAHDLRTPLSILRGYLEGLKEEQIQGTPVLYHLMHEEVLHLQRLVEDLRVLSLADAGELSLNKRVVDPTALLERTGLLYFVAAEQQGIRLRVDVPMLDMSMSEAENGSEDGNEDSNEDSGEDHGDGEVDALPSIYVDTDRITQVLNNLVSNALRHTKQGEIVLRARATASHVLLSIQDSGNGIAAEDLPFVFDRFYRGDKSRQRTDSTADSASSGLGLAIAKAIVEAHDGAIQVESTPGSGTTFTIALPIAESHP